MGVVAPGSLEIAEYTYNMWKMPQPIEKNRGYKSDFLYYRYAAAKEYHLVN